MINPHPRSQVSRRRWFGAGAGIVGAAISTALAERGLAAAPDDDTTGSLDQVDSRELMVLMMRAELTTRDLYDLALEAGTDPAVTGVMSAQHRAYADAISGAIGASASGRNDRLFDELAPAFRSSSLTTMATAAADLESSLVATYEQVVALVTDGNWIRIVSSIAMMEARHTVVLRTLAGDASDLGALLDPTTAPLTLQELG